MSSGAALSFYAASWRALTDATCVLTRCGWPGRRIPHSGFLPHRPRHPSAPIRRHCTRGTVAVGHGRSTKAAGRHRATAARGSRQASATSARHRRSRWRVKFISSRFGWAVAQPCAQPDLPSASRLASTLGPKKLNNGAVPIVVPILVALVHFHQSGAQFVALHLAGLCASVP